MIEILKSSKDAIGTEEKIKEYYKCPECGCEVGMTLRRSYGIVNDSFTRMCYGCRCEWKVTLPKGVLRR